MTVLLLLKWEPHRWDNTWLGSIIFYVLFRYCTFNLLCLEYQKRLALLLWSLGISQMQLQSLLKIGEHRLQFNFLGNAELIIDLLDILGLEEAPNISSVISKSVSVKSLLCTATFISVLFFTILAQIFSFPPALNPACWHCRLAHLQITPIHLQYIYAVP